MLGVRERQKYQGTPILTTEVINLCVLTTGITGILTQRLSPTVREPVCVCTPSLVCPGETSGVQRRHGSARAAAPAYRSNAVKCHVSGVRCVPPNAGGSGALAADDAAHSTTAASTAASERPGLCERCKQTPTPSSNSRQRLSRSSIDHIRCVSRPCFASNHAYASNFTPWRSYALHTTLVICCARM